MTFYIKCCLALVVAAVALPRSLTAQVLEWHGGIATSGTGASTFVAVETSETSGSQTVFMAGNGSSNFQLEALKLLALPARPSGVVVGATRNAATGTLAPDWQARAESSMSVTFTDLALLPATNQLVICGHFEKDITFKADLLGLPVPLIGEILLSPGSGTHGFFALVDRSSGAWQSAFLTPGILPTSITCDSATSTIITGQGTLAARFSVSNGALVWETAATLATTRQVHIAARSGSSVFVLGEESSALPAEGVVLTCLNPASGAVLWTRRMGGPGRDVACGLAVDDFACIHLSFRSTYSLSTFGSFPIAVADPTSGDTLFTTAISPDGSLNWIVPVSRPSPQDPALPNVLASSNLAVDSTGGTWLACTAAGTWAFGDSPATLFTQDPLVIHVDAAGTIHEWMRASGDHSTGSVNAIAVAGLRTIFSAGDYSGTSAPDFSPLPALPIHLVSAAFLASLEAKADQQLWVARPNPASPALLSIPALRSLLELLGASVYAEVDSTPGPQAISFWATPAILAALLVDPRVIVTPESQLRPSGANGTPGWGLARIGGATSETASYNYPDSINPVRLYFIDTAVANPSNWIGANPKLTLEKSVLIRGSGDPVSSSEFKHGTQMLSLIAGRETGATPGTPIRVVNYDIYPQGGTTSTTLLAKAVTEAVKDYRNSTNPLPAAICIASSSTAAATSYTLQSSIQMAISEGIPVIISAGNLGANASAYIPSAYGTIEGVICTGATDRSDKRLTSSNFGAAVDLLAPGLEIRTLGINPAAPFELMSGTSPAAALAAAAALIEISVNGTRSPAVIESALKATAAKPSSGPPLLRVIVAPPAIAPDGPITDPASPIPLSSNSSGFAEGSGTAPADSDSDGIPNLVETFRGTNPALKETVNPLPAISLSANQQTQFCFPISRDLFDSSHPFSLRNGYIWRVRCTATFTSWNVPNGSLSKFTDAAGQVWITATFPATGPACFARVEIATP